MTLPADAAAPVLAVAGGAGVMGAFFAELLLPQVRACLLIDRFASAGELTDAGSVPPQSLVERLVAVMARQGLQTLLVAPGRPPRDLTPASVAREVRIAPAWLLFHAPAQRPEPDLQAATEDIAAAPARLAALPGVRHVVGLLMPNQATEAARAADLLLLALPYASERDFAELATPYAAGLRPGSLLADLLSLKAAPMQVLDALLPPSVGLLGMHPLFGRVVGDVAGLVVAVVPAPVERPESAWQPWLLGKLAGLGMLVTPASGDEHDSAMSYVQALSHFALLCFAYTFVRANQDPTLLLPFRTPVFEPLLYLAARVAALARRSPDVYRAIQEECALPELRRLFVQTAQELLAAVEDERGSTGVRAHGSDGDHSTHAFTPARRPADTSAPLTAMFESFGAPWSPASHRDAEPYEHLVAMSNSLTEPVNALRHALVQSAGRVRAIRNTRTGAVALGAVYVDPLHHDRVDLASRVRFHRFNLTSGALDGVDPSDLADQPGEERRGRLEATLASLPLGQVQLLAEPQLVVWLDAGSAPRSGPDDLRGADDLPGAGRTSAHADGSIRRPRYAGKAHFDLSLLVPDWLDSDCLQRLLAGRRVGTDLIAAATLRPQERGRSALLPGFRAVFVLLDVLLLPDAILELRVQARQQAKAEEPAASRSQRRRREDRRFLQAVTARHLALRAFALQWLLAHGCRPAQPASTD